MRGSKEVLTDIRPTPTTLIPPHAHSQSILNMVPYSKVTQNKFLNKCF